MLFYYYKIMKYPILLVLISNLIFGCSTKIPRPLVSSQNRLKDLSLWNKESKAEKIDLILDNVFLKENRRDRLKNEYPQGIILKSTTLSQRPFSLLQRSAIKGLPQTLSSLSSIFMFFCGKKVFGN